MTETNAYGPGELRRRLRDPPLEHRPGRAHPRRRGPRRRRPGAGGAAGARRDLDEGADLIRGYWDKPEATAEAFVDGWLRTGDIGRLDDEGFVYVEDRAKDMVLRAGENVYCAEVEAALYEHPAVYEAAVFGVPDERLGEEVVAVVNPKARPLGDRRRVQEHVPGTPGRFQGPGRIVLTDGACPARLGQDPQAGPAGHASSSRAAPRPAPPSWRSRSRPGRRGQRPAGHAPRPAPRPVASNFGGRGGHGRPVPRSHAGVPDDRPPPLGSKAIGVGSHRP